MFNFFVKPLLYTKIKFLKMVNSKNGYQTLTFNLLYQFILEIYGILFKEYIGEEENIINSI